MFQRVDCFPSLLRNTPALIFILPEILARTLSCVRLKSTCVISKAHTLITGLQQLDNTAL